MKWLKALDSDVRKTKRLEGLHLKIINKKCLNNNLLQKYYTYIYIYIYQRKWNEKVNVKEVSAFSFRFGLLMFNSFKYFRKITRSTSSYRLKKF